MCGGLDEVMAAAARGAKGAGGITLGILPGESKDDANPWIDHVVVHGGLAGRDAAVQDGHGLSDHNPVRAVIGTVGMVG